MAAEFTKDWMKFFADCGLPDDVATIYALIFSENRIKKNMLLDLNKEYLRDMGITVMGDVIAILKNAKVAHEKYYREQIFADNDTVNNEQSEKIHLNKSMTTKNMIEHFNRKYNSLDSESPSDVQVIVENNTQSSILTPIQNSNVKTPITRKKIEVSIQNSVKQEDLQFGNLKISNVLQANEKKQIKVIPKAPEKSKKIIEQAKKKQGKTVFDRLGESSVTSTTSEFFNNNSVSSCPSDINKDKNSSVFSRLGEKASLVSSTSSSGIDSHFVSKEQLSKAKIFKVDSSNKKIISSTTMRADDEQKKSIVRTNLNKPAPIKKRLGAETRVPDAQNSISASKRQPISFEENQLKPSMVKLKNYSHVPLLDHVKKEITAKNKLLVQKIGIGQKREIVSSTTKPISLNNNTVKRKLNSNESDSVTSPKKVRFGRTTHRLIPSTTMPAESTSNVKNYPKLTMTINNNSVKPSENVLSFGNVRAGSLNSDKIREKISISERIGKKGIELHLKKRTLDSQLTTSLHPTKKFCSVRDRLG